MPQIIVMTDTTDEAQDPAVMFSERVNVSDFESSHFQTQLVERLGWAVGDAHAVEQHRYFGQDAELTEPRRYAAPVEHERYAFSDASPAS